MAIKVQQQSGVGAAQPLGPAHATASGNSFSTRVIEGFDPEKRGIPVSSGHPGAKFKMYKFQVRYEDTKDLFKDINDLWVNTTAKEVVHNWGARDDRNVEGSMGSTIKRVGPHTFEGTTTVLLEAIPGKSREDARAVAFAFAKFNPSAPNPMQDARWDGKPFQKYQVPIHLTGPR